jgi:hypothetical protein
MALGHWKQPEKHWCNSELPIDDVDITLFVAATRVTVRNGHMARFWTTDWFHGSMLAQMFPVLFRHSRRKNKTIVEAMALETWIRDLMHDVTTDILAEYVILLFSKHKLFLAFQTALYTIATPNIYIFSPPGRAFLIHCQYWVHDLGMSLW